MATDTFVYWKEQRPTRDEIRMCLEDYVRGLASEVVWDEDRFFVTLNGQFSYPFARAGTSTPSMREVARERASDEREFEVWFDDECLDVITRFGDEITNNIARGFAVLVARGWSGRVETYRLPAASPQIVAVVDATLDSMTRRPALWGPLPCVELQVLRLLEVRALVAGAHEREHEVAPSYRAFLAEHFPDSPPVSLRTRVDDNEDEFRRLLSNFVHAERVNQGPRASSR